MCSRPGGGTTWLPCFEVCLRSPLTTPSRGTSPSVHQVPHHQRSHSVLRAQSWLPSTTTPQISRSTRPPFHPSSDETHSRSTYSIGRMLRISRIDISCLTQMLRRKRLLLHSFSSRSLTGVNRSLQATQQELERQRASDNLKKSLEHRPDREELVNRTSSSFPATVKCNH